MPGRFHPEGPQHPDSRQGERVHTACADNPDPRLQDALKRAFGT
jgi:hypothetical protein